MNKASLPAADAFFAASELMSLRRRGGKRERRGLERGGDVWPGKQSPVFTQVRLFPGSPLLSYLCNAVVVVRSSGESPRQISSSPRPSSSPPPIYRKGVGGVLSGRGMRDR